MTLKLVKKNIKFMGKDQSIAFVRNAINTPMDAVIYSNSGAKKTLITDGLATCAAIVIYGSDSACSMAFTHMSSATTEEDDNRKEKILNEMLAYVLKNNSLSDLKLVISPSRILEKHLISFILEWVNQKKIACTVLANGGDSAVFNIDKDGQVLMLSTSLKLRQNLLDNTWHGTGVVISQNEDRIVLEKPKNPPVFFRPEISALPDSYQRVANLVAVKA